MTISTTVAEIGYNGDGVSTVFTIPWLFFANSDLSLYQTDNLGGVSPVTTAVIAGANLGAGTATLLAPLPVNYKLTIALTPQILQLQHYISNDPFPAPTFEQSLDRLTQISQYIQFQLTNAVRAPVAESNALMLLPSAAARANTYPVFDNAGNLSTAVTLPSGTLTSSTIATTLDSLKRTAAEIAAGVVPVNYAYAPRPIADLTRYGGAAGAGDNTAAMNSAIAVLNSQGGGIIKIPYPGEWRMNVVIAAHNITIEGPGGRAEFDTFCIRPFSLASPAITVGDGVNVWRWCGLVNCHISGTNGVNQLAANCAPQGLLVKGGTIGLKADRCVIYSGIQTLALVPSATQPVTGCTFINTIIRQDNTDSASARAIYSLRLGGNGYNTDNSFIKCKVNAVSTLAGAYAAELDGPISFYMESCYWDIKPGLGFILKNGAGIYGINSQLDPAATGVVVIETTDVGTDFTRIVFGNLIVENQLWKNGTATTFAIPAGANDRFYSPAIRQPYLRTPAYLSKSTNTYDTSAFFDQISDVGPLVLWNDTGLGVGGLNGEYWALQSISFLQTLSIVSTITDIGGALPANSIIEAVNLRVTVGITTAASLSVGDPTTPTRFINASASVALNSTIIGLNHSDQTGAAGPKQLAATSLRLSTNVNPGAGQVRVTIVYRSGRAPTS